MDNLAPQIDVETCKTCWCGTNEHLVVVGISPIFQFTDGKLAWVVECWNHEMHKGKRPMFYIDDDGRDELFGTGWRNSGSGDD